MASELNQTPLTAATAGGDVEINLSELFYRLLEKWLLIALCAIVGAAIAAVYTFKLVTPMYEATAKMYVMNQSDSAINLSDLQIGSYLTSDYQEVFKAWEVHEGVISNLNLAYSYTDMQNMLTISNPSDTRVLYVTVTSPDPEEAALIANEYVTVSKRYITETMDTEEPHTMSVALTPNYPVKPNKTLNLMLGFILGALFALAVVIVRFVLDDKLKTADDIAKYVGVSTLSVVPAMKKGREERKAKSGRRR